jgi:hypothetical protein
MTGVEIGAAAKALSGVAAKPALRKLGRTPGVVAMLQKLHLRPETPPSDFEGVYVYAFVEYCYGKPDPVIELFKDEYVRAAFRRSFDNHDSSHLDREVQNLIDRKTESGELRGFDYNLALEVTGFAAVFNRLVSLTRSVAETRAENKIDGLQATLDALVTRIDQASTREEIVHNELGLPVTPLQRLERDVRDWFDAIEYRIDRELAGYTDCFVWLVRVPARRGYDLTVVYGQDGELGVPQIEHLRELVAETRAKEGWAIVPSRISPAARKADEDYEEIYCYTFDELLDDRADFEPYLQWLEQEVTSRAIADRYVTLSCKKEEHEGDVNAVSEYSWRQGGLDDYVSRWLDDDTKEHLSVLGEFGTGKTWFTLHYAWTLAQDWRKAKQAGRRRPRVPLVIPLRDYAKAVSVESLFSEFFFRKHGILHDYRVFEALNRLGKLLLIFDGFDEMAAKIDRQAMINNFWELARAVVPGAKVLLTCRTEHFPEAKQGRELLGAKLQASTASLTGEPPQFEVVEVAPFDLEQIGILLGRATDAVTMQRILSSVDLLELVSRPVMCDLVLTAMPEIEAGEAIDLSRVYLYAIRRKIDEDIRAERTFTSRADKLFFLCQLASYMEANSVMSLNYRDFPDRIRECFGEAVQTQRDLDHWHYDMMGQTMLVRNSAGDYAPAHRSLLEFFVAYQIVAELGLMAADFMSLAGVEYDPDGVEIAWADLSRSTPEQRARVSSWAPGQTDRLAELMGREWFSPQVWQLATAMLRENVTDEIVARAVDASQRTSEDSPLAKNCVKFALWSDPAALSGRDLDGIRLGGSDFGMDGRIDDLSGARMRGADLRNCHFGAVKLVDADLSGASFEGTRFTNQGPEHISSLRHAHGKLLATTTAGEIWAYAMGAEFRKMCSLDGFRFNAYPIGAPEVLLSHEPGRHQVLNMNTFNVVPFDIPNLRPIGQSGDDILIVQSSRPEDKKNIRLRTFSISERAVLDEFVVERFESFERSETGRLFFYRRESSDILASALLVSGGGRMHLGREFTIPVPDRQMLGWSAVNDAFCVRTLTQDLDAGERGRLRFFGLDGSPVADLSLPAPTHRPQTRRQLPSSLEFVDMNPGLGIAVESDNRGVNVLDMADGSMRFAIAAESISALDLFDGILYIADHFGNLERWDARTGTRIDTVNISTNLRGARFTGATGLTDSLRQKLRSAGAVVD